VAASAAAQEYKPYPRPRITPEQWRQYFGEVVSKHAASRRELATERLVIFENTTEYTTYVFTLPGHAAHPAWVTRQLVEDDKGVNVRQIGYFAGEEEPFSRLFREYQQRSAKIREDLKRKARE
jgi:hypothetical protein